MRSLLAVASTRLGRVVLSLCFFLAIGIGSVNLGGRTVYARADAWVAARAGALPNTLGELAAYPQAYREAIVKALPAAEKSRLWHEQLQGLLDTRRDLTSEQREFIQHTMTLVTVESFAPNAEHPKVCRDMFTLFPDPEMRIQVSKLGTSTAPERRARAVLVSAMERIRNSVTVRAIDECNCAGGVPWCNGCKLLDTCTPGNCTTGATCGCIWTEPCNGLCSSEGGSSSSSRPSSGTKDPIK